jgi:hypothetical protein
MDGNIQRKTDECCYDARSGQTSTVTCVEVKEQIDQRIRDNEKWASLISEMNSGREKKRFKTIGWDT